jgi:hypothetical protein
VKRLSALARSSDAPLGLGASPVHRIHEMTQGSVPQPPPAPKANRRRPLYLLSPFMPQDDDERIAAQAIISAAQRSDPRRLLEVIADVACQFKAKGYTTAEIERAITEMLEELEQSFCPRH